jgi:hypothetical protein
MEDKNSNFDCPKNLFTTERVGMYKTLFLTSNNDNSISKSGINAEAWAYLKGFHEGKMISDPEYRDLYNKEFIENNEEYKSQNVPLEDTNKSNTELLNFKPGIDINSYFKGFNVGITYDIDYRNQCDKTRKFMDKIRKDIYSLSGIPVYLLGIDIANDKIMETNDHEE